MLWPYWQKVAKELGERACILVCWMLLLGAIGVYIYYFDKFALTQFLTIWDFTPAFFAVIFTDIGIGILLSATFYYNDPFG